MSAALKLHTEKNPIAWKVIRNSGNNNFEELDYYPSDSTYILTTGLTFQGFILKLNQDPCALFYPVIDSVANLSCLDTGYIFASVRNGMPPYSYQWNTPSISSDSTLALFNDGIYTLFVSDSAGCLKSKKILINGANLNGIDLESYLHASNFRTGFTSNIWLDGFNDGCSFVSGTLSLVLDPLVSYNSSIPPPDNISGDTLFWNFTDLIYDSLHITPVINVTTNAQIGDTVCFEVMINPIAGDADSSNNYKTYCFPVINGYDPNFKQVYPQGECIPNYVLNNNEPLTYTVHFQNTGNADAINIHILDTLDANLDLNTLRVIGNSHYVITEILPGNVMNFRFDNIHLPDSGANEIASHGYVIYEVYPNVGTPQNTLIENTANIYFDFNPAIITNKTINTLVDSIPSFSTTENISVCYDSDYTLPDGTIFINITSPISHQSNLWMVDGCDSVITTNISVLPALDTTTSLNNFSITANASGSTYQWMDCNSGLPISGETNQSFTPTVNGDYAVIINDGNCSDTSTCVSITTLGTNTIDFSSLVKIYPNPAKNEFTVFLSGENTNATIEIYNLNGQLLQSINTSSKSKLVSLNDFSSGLYFVKVKSETESENFKLVKE